MADGFTANEMLAVRKLFSWLTDGEWLDGYGEGITGFSDEGIIVTTYTCGMEYGAACMDRETTVISWLALSNPDEYDRQVAAEAAAERAESERRQAVLQRERQAALRAEYERLKAQFEPGGPI